MNITANIPAVLPSRTAALMNESFFGMDQDGVLVYKDPFIGRLENRRLDLVVRINAEATTLELHAGDTVIADFEFSDNVVHACRDAFGAYFSEFERRCRREESRRHEAA